MNHRGAGWGHPALQFNLFYTNKKTIASYNPQARNREQQVLILRFGLKDGKPRTLEEVGQHFNVTRERIRQIEGKALTKLRNRGKRDKIKDFL